MPPPPHFVKDIATGPLMGTFGILLLYGMTVMQAYQYYTTFGSDQLFIKILVGVVLVLESLHLAFSAHGNYYYLIEHWGEPEYMLRIVWSEWVGSEIGFVVAWLVNMFFVRRVYVLSKKLWLAIGIGILATIRPGFGFVTGTYPLIYPQWADYHKHCQWMFIVMLSIALAVDFLIAFTISYYLLKARDTNVQSTRNIVQVLLRYTVNTTAILTFFAVLEFIFLLYEPKTLTFLGLFQIQIQLYVNCFLTSLNARQSLRGNMTHVSVAAPMVTFKAASTHVISTDLVANATDLGNSTTDVESKA